MYQEYWGLREKPFENTPDPRFFFASVMHQEALDKLLYAFHSQKGCALLSGEYGCGKTFLVRKILDSIASSQYDLALLNYPIFTANEFLREVLFQLGKETKQESRLELFKIISSTAFENLRADKRNLIIIDEAQLIEEPQIFEEIRLLLNLQMQDAFLINIFLVGQPELREHVMQYPQLDQRISVRYHLRHFDEEEVVGYMLHRLKTAGATREIFNPAAYYLIFKISQGVARRINNLCDLCLLDGFNNSVSVIDEAVIKRNL